MENLLSEEFVKQTREVCYFFDRMENLLREISQHPEHLETLAHKATEEELQTFRAFFRDEAEKADIEGLEWFMELKRLVKRVMEYDSGRGRKDLANFCGEFSEKFFTKMEEIDQIQGKIAALLEIDFTVPSEEPLEKLLARMSVVYVEIMKYNIRIPVRKLKKPRRFCAWWDVLF